MMKLLAAVCTLLAWEGALAFTSCPAFKRTSTKCNLKIDGRAIMGEIKPSNNFVLVKIAKEVDKSDGGILLSGKSKIKKTEGMVVSVGPGGTHQETGEIYPMPVKAGEGVVYGKFDGTGLDIDGEKHTLIRDVDVLLKFTGDELTLETADVVRDHVLVYTEEVDSTEGGLLLSKSSSSESRPSTGVVIKVGPGKLASNGKLAPMEVASGDNVKFRDYAGNDVVIEGKDYCVVRMVDILAKF
jgi:chaperonin GroES